MFGSVITTYAVAYSLIRGAIVIFVLFKFLELTTNIKHIDLLLSDEFFDLMMLKKEMKENEVTEDDNRGKSL